MRRRLISPVALAVALAAPATAHAAWFPAEQVDGPSGDIVSVGDVDVNRDGVGILAYVKRDGGVEHVFMTRFFGGVWEPPARADGGLAGASSQPVVTTGNENRMAIAYVNDGTLFTSVRPKDAQGFTAPRALASGGVSDPAIDMSINGVTYLSFTQGGDVKVARAERDSDAFNLLPGPVDVDPGREAGTGAMRSRIAVSADGTALVVWGENGGDGRTHVFARRLFEFRLSQAPQDATPADVDGSAARDADSPEVDIELDSSFAQVVYRQAPAGGSRVVSRRLVGSGFEAPERVDNGATATEGRVAVTGHNERLFATQLGGNEVMVGTVFENKFTGLTRWDQGANGVASHPVPVLAANEDGEVAWVQGGGPGDASTRGRFFDDIQRPQIGPEANLNNPAWGPTDVRAGLDAGGSRGADAVVAFVQDTGAERRLVAAVYDTPPSRPVGHNTTKKRRLRRFAWSPSRELFGPVLYRVMVDGRVVGETAESSLPVTSKMGIRDGKHKWQIVAIDRRGQQRLSRTRSIWVDNVRPKKRKRARGSALGAALQAAAAAVR